jgi:homocysteine S-methyltransferase
MMMATHRRDLPWLGKETFLTDGGMETTLIFHRGIDLPQFAAFPLLDDAKGRAELNAYYESYLAIARQHDRGFILDTATWRASTDWGAMLGYDAAALRKANLRAVEFIAGLRRKWERPGLPIILNGVIGPRGDAYQQGQMGVGEAQDYHGPQIRTFAETELDMITALTLNRIEEAIGITRAAEEAGLPCVISFTVETDGRLVGGMSLQEAIETTDKETDAYPIHYMINCAHPTHFDQLLRHDKPWIGRIGGMRANASAKSHAELDESIEVDIGDPVDLGRRYRSLQAAHPSIKVLGGCCGTDQRHLAAICEACATSVAAE